VEYFEVNDSIYNQFKAFINPEKFQYDKVCEDGLKQLREVADTEGYMNDSTKEVFAQLEKLLKHDLQKDLDLHRKLISQILAVEIVQRYYYQRGECIQELKDDPALDAIVKLFSDPREYYSKLGIKK
jgi:carboxyl-terminal processing protease